MTNVEIIEYVRPLVSQYFKDEQGKPLVLTDGQCLIFDLIYRKPYPRVHLEAFTRYGKSQTIACAILLRVTTYPEKWAVAAGNDKQAGIIMAYVIQHIFDHPYFRNKFEIPAGESEEHIRRYRNKSRLNFNVEKGSAGQFLLGEVYITNAKGALGFGAPNVVGDEAALIPDDEEVLINRMLGDQTDNFYMKVGNPWDSGHFDQSREDPRYFKMVIDYKQGISEGRFTVDQMLEMQKKPFWGVLYECRRPPRDSMDEQGWMPLLTKEDIDRAVVRAPNVLASELSGFGVNRLGGDIAGGGKNLSVLVQRFTNLARILLRTHDPDTMSFGEAIMNAKRARFVQPHDIAVDNVGVGKGVYDILSRTLAGVRGINGGDRLPEGTQDEELFFNFRAAMYWRLREWLLKGGKLLLNDDDDLQETWYQLTRIFYRQRLEGTHGKVQIMPKEIMLKRGIQSPDVADALALTFFTARDSVSGSGPVVPDNNADFDRNQPIVTV